MKLIIAEKPKMAKAIARAIGASPDPKVRGAYEGGDYRIVSCEGHILEQLSPQGYDERYKRWRIEDLPIHPEQWKLKLIENKGRYLTMIRNGMKNSDVVVSAADPDAEGQLLVDEVLHHLNWKGVTLRVLINDLNPKPILKALDNLEDNNSDKFQGLYRRALSRSRGDWLLGMNLTRFYTVMGREFGLDQVLSAGRVQSAVLGMVVRRDLEIENFKPHDYYAINGRFGHEKGAFTAKWNPVEGQSGLDDSGRLIDPDIAQGLTEIAPEAAEIVEHEVKRQQQNAPKPFSMSDLQKEASRKFGMTMAQVLEIAQALYDKHELITYPRSDTGYLPEGHHEEGPVVLAAIRNNLGSQAVYCDNADPSIKSQAFNDAKVKAHHGIIPTAKNSQQAILALNAQEKRIYEMICRRYAAQFFPPAEFNATRLLAKTLETQQLFKATGKQWLAQGWRVTLDTKAADEDAESEEESEATGELPPMQKGDALTLEEVVSQCKQTNPPKHFTDGSLLDAMTSIHRFVEDPKIRAMLKEGDGIGTEATRANILEKLVKHGLIVREKKLIKSTMAGQAHYHLMPQAMTTPDMAGLFESRTRQIEDGETTLESFLESVDGFIREQLSLKEDWGRRARELGLEPPKKTPGPPCRHCESELTKVKSKLTKKFLMLCKACNSLFEHDSGLPGFCVKGPLKEQDMAAKQARRQERMKDAPPCPECQAPILRFKSTKTQKHFWRCTGCESFYTDLAGKLGPAFVVRGEKVEPKADGPPCPECESNMSRQITKKKKPFFLCRECDTMCWSDEGELGKVFKRRGEMVNTASKTKTSD
ncbi:DNA topoisomerase 3 [Vreelandella rituensis]|uniref:DNA topoisomerase n=1 Tax=Vreelandella rituensis TaxID=2282306 RepID=A0A368UA34_9GAMM|nr:DNA topoisomerase 3 [Halomonas rituensis]RCV93834.1 DNA topoisomerase III [Halomonas rituensis]